MFWISKYFPRIPHPREVLSINYSILDWDPIARKIFERQNLVAGSKRGKNLQELISLTVQKHKQNSPQNMDQTFQEELSNVNILKLVESVHSVTIRRMVRVLWFQDISKLNRQSRATLSMSLGRR